MSYSYADDSRFPGPDPYAPLKNLPEFPLTSTDLEDGAELPEQLRAPSSVSPQLSWSDLPAGTKSVAVTCFDPDAPTASGFWHWAAFDIPVDVTELPANAGAKGISASEPGPWPMTPVSEPTTELLRRPATPPHRYLYAVHAVDVEKLDVPEDATATVLGFNLYFHSIGRAVLWGWYEAS